MGVVIQYAAPDFFFYPFSYIQSYVPIAQKVVNCLSFKDNLLQPYERNIHAMFHIYIYGRCCCVSGVQGIKLDGTKLFLQEFSSAH